MKNRRFLVLWLLVFLTLPILCWGQPRSIRVVMDDNYPPFVFKTEEGALQGILVDQWRLWEKKTGIPVELHATDWNLAQKRMLAGEFNVIDTLFRTPQREPLYDFSPPYVTLEVPVFFNREIHGISSIDTLKGFNVAVKDGDAVAEFLKNKGVTTLSYYPSYEAIIKAVKEGKVSVFSIDQPPAVYLLYKYGLAGNFNRTAPFYSGQFHRAVRKGDQATLRLVLEGFQAITPLEFKKIEERWYGSAALLNEKDYSWLLWTAGGISLLALLLLAWNWGLRRILFRKTHELQESEHNYRELVQGSDSIILRWQRDGSISFINEYGARFFGFEPEELVGASLFATIIPSPQQDGRDLFHILHDIFEHADEYRINLNQNQRKDGSLVWISWSNRPICDEQGQVMEMLSVGVDITARIEAEEALKKNQQELVTARQAAEKANDAKSLFLANMSHEIRTPLNAIIGINSLLVERLEQGELKELAKDSMAAANNLLDIISDVLDISKIEAGKLEVVRVPFDPRMLVNQLERMFGTIIREKGLRFDVSLAANLPGMLISDPARIQQIGVNLLSNALKFTEQGTVRLRLAGTTLDENNVQLELVVSDSGKGILAENLGRVFSPFVQEDLSTTRKFGGTGLGLSISKHLAEMLGGSIKVESRIGEGSTFTCSIPCRIAQKELAESVTVDDPERMRCRRLSILVAEDSVVNCKMMEAILRMEGHRVCFADNGRKAVEAWRQESFDLILMDIQMPEMDGVQATAIIRAAEAEKGGHIPIVALTAYAMSGDKQRFLDAGMDAYLPKPITTEQLRRLLWEYGREAA